MYTYIQNIEEFSKTVLETDSSGKNNYYIKIFQNLRNKYMHHKSALMTFVKNKY